MSSSRGFDKSAQLTDARRNVPKFNNWSKVKGWKANRTSEKVLLSSLQLNGHTSGFHPQTLKKSWTTLYRMMNRTTGNYSTILFFRIFALYNSSTDTKVYATWHSIINSTTRKYFLALGVCSNIKKLGILLQGYKPNHGKVLLSCFHINGHTLGRVVSFGEMLTYVTRFNLITLVDESCEGWPLNESCRGKHCAARWLKLLSMKFKNSNEICLAVLCCDAL